MEQNQNQNPQNNQQAQQQATQQPPQFVCTGDCKKCRSMQQWSYCASIHAYSNMKVLDRVMETLVGMQGAIQAMQSAIQELSAKIDVIQNGEAAVFDPNGEGELFPKEFAVDQPEAEAAAEAAK